MNETSCRSRIRCPGEEWNEPSFLRPASKELRTPAHHRSEGKQRQHPKKERIEWWRECDRCPLCLRKNVASMEESWFRSCEEKHACELLPTPPDSTIGVERMHATTEMRDSQPHISCLRAAFDAETPSPSEAQPRLQRTLQKCLCSEDNIGLVRTCTGIEIPFETTRFPWRAKGGEITKTGLMILAFQISCHRC